MIINLCATLLLTGLIWFVQVVHYPGYQHIAPSSFQGYHRRHIRRTGFVVIPPMLTELATSTWLVWRFEQFQMINIAGLSLVIAIWTSTFALQARYHQNLQREYNQTIIVKLISTNWIRTILWSLKSILGIYILFELI